MLKHEEFNALVHEYYSDYALDYMNELVESGIDEYRDRLSASAEMDSIRWTDMYKEWGYTTGDGICYEELKDFIKERVTFLNGEWLK